MYGLLLFKVCLGCTAYRAFPIIRHIFPLGAGGYAIIRITLFWIVNIPTDLTYVLVHHNPPFEMGSGYSRQLRYIEIGVFFVQADPQFLLYCSWVRFKSIFMLLYFNQASSARRIKQLKLNHENTKFKKHEILLFFSFRVFVLS